MSAAAGRRPIVPASLLRAFADGRGRVLMERRDRARRAVVDVEAAAAAGGLYAAPPAGDVARLLARVEDRAAGAIRQTLGGVFPPRGEDRAHLALFLAFLLRLGRGHREDLSDAADAIDALVSSRLEAESEDGEDDEEGGGGEEADNGEDADDDDDDEDDEEEEDDEADDEEDGTEEASGEPGGEPARRDVVVLDGEAARIFLAGATDRARVISGWTWQLLRFPRRLLLTGDTPAVLWRRPGRPASDQIGLAAADEVRFPLDPRHALVVARKAALGEVVRELDERHARALNRTVAEAARRWTYYHPESDPLDSVELWPAAG